MLTERIRPTTVLLVEADEAERCRLAGALEAGGYEVLECPGPSAPDYTCVGGRDGACPLIAGAAVVVLDMALDSEAVLEGTAAEELLGLYLMSGRPVVVLGSRPGDDIPGQLARLRRHADEPAVVDAIGVLIGARPRPAMVSMTLVERGGTRR